MSSTSSTNVVWTPYYRTIPDVSPGACVDQPEFNYNFYKLFVLKTNLQVWINVNISPKVYPIFPSKEKDNKMYVTVELIQGRVNIILEPSIIRKLQDQVNRIVDEQSVILLTEDNFLTVDYIENYNPLVFESTKRVMPAGWVAEVLPYLSLDTLLNPYINEAYPDAPIKAIFIDLSWYPDYGSLFREIEENVIRQLDEMYREGYVVDPPKNVINNWDLVPSDVDERLYHPVWSDTRITRRYGGMTPFLQSRILGGNYIEYLIGNNNVVRHNLAREMINRKTGFYFNGNYLNVLVNDLKTAQTVTSIIYFILADTEGRVLTLYLNATLSKKATLIAKAAGYTDSLDYRIVSNPQYDHIWSCKITYEENSEALSEKILSQISNEQISF